ncbi:hypothetical protein DRH29_01390 [candidate division Kazan bacterium]|uniref:Fibronectin type-III domain-containing protein n=1 Tax=candidate division Kazan bacterium TaxID=2202143 RepID=A0A420ZDM9_UNCK3|nr:MAG: hypothetical protein DRH29_01390 [candidate division Kazan bacterium]
MKIKISYIFLGILLLSAMIAPLRAVAAIDAPWGVVVEEGDSKYDLRLWWANPNIANLDHINLYMAAGSLEHPSVIEVGGEQARPHQIGTYQVEDLISGVWYYFYLVAVDTKGNESPRTDYYKRRTGIAADVTSPYSVSSVFVNDVRHDGLTLNWANPGDDDFYRTLIYRSTDSNVLASETNLLGRQVALPSTVKKYVDSGLEPETTYYYRLVAEDVKGNKSESVIVSETTQAAPVAEPEPEPVEPSESEDQDDAGIVPDVMPNPALFDYRAEWVSQSGTVNNAGTAHVVTASVGETITLELTLKNTGSSWWYFKTPDNAHEVKIGTWNEADRISLFKADSWLSVNRASTLDAVVPTGSMATFSFDLTIPADTAAGVYSEYFRPVAEYVEWFGPTGIFWEIEVN